MYLSIINVSLSLALPSILSKLINEKNYPRMRITNNKKSMESEGGRSLCAQKGEQLAFVSS